MLSWHWGYCHIFNIFTTSSANRCMLLTSILCQHLIMRIALRYGRHLVQQVLHLFSSTSRRNCIWFQIQIPSTHQHTSLSTSGVRQGGVLAPALFFNWIMSRCAGTTGITVSSTTFTDQVCADDVVLFTDDTSRWTRKILTCFDAACHHHAHVMAQDSSPKRRLWNPTACGMIRQLEVDVGLTSDAAWDTHGHWPVIGCLEGATTLRRSSGPVSELVYVQHIAPQQIEIIEFAPNCSDEQSY